MTEGPGLTPEHDAVRRLLADARHDGPPPPEVVARLDDALASLVAERGGSPLSDDRGPSASTHVADLGARRRRTVGLGLLAAAAVVVAGIAVGQGLPGTSGGQSDSSSSADGGAAQEPQLSDQGSASAGGGAADSQETAPQTKLDASGVPTLSTTDPDLDQQLLDLRPAATARRGVVASSEEPGAFCLRGIGPGRRLAAEVDGRPGVIVYEPRSGDAQEVAIFVCGNGTPVRTLLLPPR